MYFSHAKLAVQFNHPNCELPKVDELHDTSKFAQMGFAVAIDRISFKY